MPEPRVIHENKTIVALLRASLDICEAIESLVSFVINVTLENVFSDYLDSEKSEDEKCHKPYNINKRWMTYLSTYQKSLKGVLYTEKLSMINFSKNSVKFIVVKLMWVYAIFLAVVLYNRSLFNTTSYSH